MKTEWLYNALIHNGATVVEATELLRLDKKFNLSSLKRKWRSLHPKEEKNMAKAEEYRRAFEKQVPIPTLSVYETAKKLRQESDPNLTFNI